MKFVIIIVFFLAVWFLIDEFVLSDRREEGLYTFSDRLRDLGRRMHMVFGILAVLIVLIMLVRFIVHTYQSQ